MSKSGQRQIGEPGIQLEEVTVSEYARLPGFVRSGECRLCGNEIVDGTRRDLQVTQKAAQDDFSYGRKMLVCRPCALEIAGFYETAGGGPA